MDFNFTINLFEPDLKKLEEQEASLVNALAMIRKAKSIFFEPSHVVIEQPSVQYVSPIAFENENKKINTSDKVKANYLENVKSIIKESNSGLTPAEIIKIMYETKNKNGIKDLNKYKNSLFPVFTRAFKRGVLSRDEKTGFVSIVK